MPWRQSFIRKSIKSKVLFLFFSVAFVYLAVTTYIQLTKVKEYHDELSRVESDIDQLKQDNLQLRELLSYLSSDEATEELARSRLGWKKEGEQAIIITSGDLKQQSRDSSINLYINNPRKWLQYFRPLQ